MKKATTDDKFDSDEEIYAYWYFSELKQAGYVKEIETQPQPFDLSKPLKSSYVQQMKTRDKVIEEEILKGHIYTTDLLITWDIKAKGILFDLIDGGTRFKERSSIKKFIAKHENGEYISYVEVKPSFDQNNMTRLAKINQKWVWASHGYYINIMIPQKWFANTFTPQRFLFTNKSGKPRKIDFAVKQLKQFLQ